MKPSSFLKADVVSALMHPTFITTVCSKDLALNLRLWSERHFPVEGGDVRGKFTCLQCLMDIY